MSLFWHNFLLNESIATLFSTWNVYLFYFLLLSPWRNSSLLRLLLAALEEVQPLFIQTLADWFQLRNLVPREREITKPNFGIAVGWTRLQTRSHACVSESLSFWIASTTCTFNDGAVSHDFAWEKKKLASDANIKNRSASSVCVCVTALLSVSSDKWRVWNINTEYLLGGTFFLVPDTLRRAASQFTGAAWVCRSFLSQQRLATQRPLFWVKARKTNKMILMIMVHSLDGGMLNVMGGSGGACPSPASPTMRSNVWCYVCKGHRRCSRRGHVVLVARASALLGGGFGGVSVGGGGCVTAFTASQ